MKKSDRNPDGTFKHGNSVQQDILKGRVTWAKRVEQLDAKYDTLEKLLQLFEKDPNTGNLRPNAELRSRHPRDVAIIMQSLNAILGDDKRLERESFWDRFEGKPVQYNVLAGDKDNPIEHRVTSATDQAILDRFLKQNAGGQTK